jgi:carboxyl-terminal processing protease
VVCDNWSLMTDFSKFFKNKTLVAVVIVAVVVVFGVGFAVGRHSESQEALAVAVANKEGVGTVDFSAFWKTWNLINEKYVPTNGTSTAPVTDQTKVYGAIQGMVASLGDPYTVFFPPVENSSFNDQISGNFQGVGMEIDVVNGVLTVISPLKGSPAMQAGIKTGDKILKIGTTTTDNMSADDAVNLIRGPAGTPVSLLVQRASTTPFTVNVTRQVIDIPTIDTETKGDVFIIHMYNFSAISDDLFRGALRSFVQSGDNKLILDLRGNPGGYLDAAIDMASWFLPAGKTVVKEDFGNNQPVQTYTSKGYNIFSSNLKMVVLIDGGSASASEILAGALHDNHVATLVGTQSYGKGSVQELVPITDDTSLKVTIARWLTPNGLSISHQGLTPDVVVPLDQTKFAAGDDTQIDAAMQVLEK